MRREGSDAPREITEQRGPRSVAPEAPDGVMEWRYICWMVCVGEGVVSTSVDTQTLLSVESTFTRVLHNVEVILSIYFMFIFYMVYIFVIL